MSRLSLLLCVPAFAVFVCAGCVQRVGQIPPCRNPYHPSYMMNRIGWINGGWNGECRGPYAYRAPDVKESYYDPFFDEERIFPRDPSRGRHKKPPKKKGKNPKPHKKPPPQDHKPPPKDHPKPPKDHKPPSDKAPPKKDGGAEKKER